MVLSFRKKSAKLARIGMACFLGYMALGFVQNYRVSTTIEQIATARGHDIERLKLNPTLGNLIVWRTTYQYDGRYYVDGVIAQPFSTPTVIKGSSVATIDPESIYPELGTNSTQRADIRRFNYFAEGYLFEYEGAIADLRYSAVPHKIQPIWGIKLDTKNPENHADYVSFTRPNGRALNVTWTMLLGEYQPTPEERAP
ncbi:MAG: hypothetical protein JKY84_10040 [Emcibacteraceae bacterium]|nr:hypothetical protein [Emcibacteraceae bacterium]